MPLGSNFTTKERAFIKEYAATGNRQHAAKVAHYAGNNISAVMQRPAVLAAIAAEQERRVYEELLPAAVNCLRELITNNNTPAGARVSACKIVFDQSIGRESEKNREKAPHEMTGEELQSTLDRLRHEAALRAHEIIDGVAEAVEETPESDLFA